MSATEHVDPQDIARLVDGACSEGEREVLLRRIGESDDAMAVFADVLWMTRLSDEAERATAALLTSGAPLERIVAKLAREMVAMRQALNLPRGAALSQAIEEIAAFRWEEVRRGRADPFAELGAFQVVPQNLEG